MWRFFPWFWIWCWTLWGLRSLLIHFNTSSFYFAQSEWVEKSSAGHFLQPEHGWGRCGRPTAVWSDAVCHVYLICTDSKRMCGWENKMHISRVQTLAKSLVSFPCLCKSPLLTRLHRTCWTLIPRGDTKDVVVGETSRPTCCSDLCGWRCLVRFCWQWVDEPLRPPNPWKNLKKTFVLTVRFHFANFVFSFFFLS